MTRASQFDGVSAVVASISCSPRQSAALQIDPPAASEFLAPRHSARESLASFDCVKGRSPDRAFEAGFKIAHFIIGSATMSNRIFISSVQRERQAVREFGPGDARLDQKANKTADSPRRHQCQSGEWTVNIGQSDSGPRLQTKALLRQGFPTGGCHDGHQNGH